MIQRLLLLTVATGLTLVGWVLIAPSASAAECHATTGTLVAVDFSHWGKPVRTGCAIGAPDGMDLLQRSGIPYTVVAKFPGAVCRISGLPAEVPTNCREMPPSSAYWSLWTAAPGSNTWTFSAVGAASDRPVKGGVEAWAFGGGARPVFSPQQIREQWQPTKPRPAPSPRVTATPSSGSASQSAGSPTSSAPPARHADGGPSSTAPGSSAPQSTVSPSADARPSASATAATSAASSARPGQIVKGAPAAPVKKASSGGPWGVLIALGIAVVLGVGGWLARRRFS